MEEKTECCCEATQQSPVEERICKVKTFRKELDAVLTEIKRVDPSRNVALSITHLEDSIMRLGMELKAIGEANPTFVKNPYPDSYKPENTNIQPTADGLFAGRPGWQQRVIEEKAELDEKIVKLVLFTETEEAKKLPEENQRGLTHQLHYMQGYAEALRKRIASFS